MQSMYRGSYAPGAEAFNPAMSMYGGMAMPYGVSRTMCDGCATIESRHSQYYNKQQPNMYWPPPNMNYAQQQAMMAAQMAYQSSMYMAMSAAGSQVGTPDNDSPQQQQQHSRPSPGSQQPQNPYMMPPNPYSSMYGGYAPSMAGGFGGMPPMMPPGFPGYPQYPMSPGSVASGGGGGSQGPWPPASAPLSGGGHTNGSGPSSHPPHPLRQSMSHDKLSEQRK